MRAVATHRYSPLVNLRVSTNQKKKYNQLGGLNGGKPPNLSWLSRTVKPPTPYGIVPRRQLESGSQGREGSLAKRT